jgi:predicted phosphodiesterase
MRWALLADVHANLEALRAVLRDLEGWPGYRLLCAGDLIGYGPDPTACLELLFERNAVCVAGNHEAMVLGRLGFERCVHAGIRAVVWTREVLPGWALDQLAALPQVARPKPELMVCHAAPDDVQTYLSSPERAAPILELLEQESSPPSLLVCGHTHFSALYARGGPWRSPAGGCSEVLVPNRLHLVNPGAVGQARDPRPVARYARYDEETRTLSYRAVSYDHALTVRKLRDVGLVPRVCLPPPSGFIEKRIENARTRFARFRYATLPLGAFEL